MTTVPLLTPVRQVILTPAQYLEVIKQDRQNIAHARFVPPVIGESGFGKIVVTYRFLPLRPING
jgi:hypothetical protein